jgi:hypothetical protein
MMKAKIRWVNQEVWLKGNLDALDAIYSAVKMELPGLFP